MSGSSATTSRRVTLSPGQQLRACRIRRGLTQHELSALAGFDVSYISKFENDERLPGTLMATRLSRALDGAIPTDLWEEAHLARADAKKAEKQASKARLSRKSSRRSKARS